jgi:hypothetical protein
MSLFPKERIVFGEWLVRKGRVDSAVLNSALEIQNVEKSDTLRTSPRLLGQILLDDFQVFRSRVDLNKALVEFEKVKAAIQIRKSDLGIRDEISSVVKLNADPSEAKTSRGPVKQAAGSSLFGQFLIEKRKVNEVILGKALDIQNLESKETLRRSHRLLGEILMDDFNVFSSRVELNRLLIEFNDFKSQLEIQRTELMYLTRDNGSES